MTREYNSNKEYVDGVDNDGLSPPMWGKAPYKTHSCAATRTLFHHGNIGGVRKHHLKQIIRP